MRWTLQVMAVSFLAAGLLAGRPAAAEPQIGAVAQAEYNGATGTRASGQTRNLMFEETVFANERVETGAQSHTQLAFLDDTKLFIGERSAVVLDRFVYDPDTQQGEAAVSLTKGAFRFVTGHIKSKGNVTLRTPTASIAVRGTVLVLFVLSDGTSEINVWEGAVDVLICDRPGPVRVNSGEALIVSSSCEGTRDRARNSGEVGYPVPRLPAEYVALEYIAPAAGPAEPDIPKKKIKPKMGSTGGDHGGGGSSDGGGGY